MRRAFVSVVVLAGVVSSGSAQLLQSVSGFNFTYCQNFALSYDSDENNSNFENQTASDDTGIGTGAFSNTMPWSVMVPNGIMSSAGEGASSNSTLSNGAQSATFNSFFAANANLFSSVASPAPYFGLAASSYSDAGIELDFTASQAAFVTLVGSFGGTGLQLSLFAALDDVTTNQTTTFLDSGTGSYSIDGMLGLNAGDSYRLLSHVSENPHFWLDPNTNIAYIDSESGTGLLTASFAPAPEPVSCVLLGLGALTVLRRRRR